MTAGASRRRAGGRRRPAPAPAADGKAALHAGNTQTGATACGACHTLAAAGTSGRPARTSTRSSRAGARPTSSESIVNPDAVIAKG